MSFNFLISYDTFIYLLAVRVTKTCNAALFFFWVYYSFGDKYENAYDALCILLLNSLFYLYELYRSYS